MPTGDGISRTSLMESVPSRRIINIMPPYTLLREPVSWRVLRLNEVKVSQGFKPAESAEAASDELFEAAVAHDRQGSRDEAERLYRAVLVAQPAHAGALHRLGAACMQSGRREEAVELLRRARTAAPTSPVAHNDLGIVLASMQKVDEARAAYEQAIALAPNYAEAHNNLGMLN